MSDRVITVWDPVLRLLHWVTALCFVLNYWVWAQGEFWHRATGYLLFCVVLLRLVWGITGPEPARFSLKALHKTQWKHHFTQLKNRCLDPHEGHNPFGFLWLYACLGLCSALALTGFMLEEVDYFFGSDQLESVHGLLADTLFVLACIHVTAVFILQWWGKLSLVKPMLTGKRRY